jgi:hypothetical protein
MAADLLQSGTIKIHSSFKTTEQVVQVGEQQLMVNRSG